ncbi:MAG: ABC transporter ATP-binding protein [bacterium]|nr:ABC transporter ATP-binding protein [bacterium]
MKIAQFQDIHRAYKKGVDVLAGVSFGVGPGEIVALLGRNGAGKTTLIRIAMGMMEAQTGSVRVFGLDPRKDAVEVKRRVGYVSEDQILPPFLKVSQVVELHRGLFPTWDDDLARRLGARFAIDPEAKIKTLSKGQARQVALLCAVAHRPELLILDEPAGGLDPAARREFLETSIRLLNESGTSILFSSHYMSDVERMADRVVMLEGGRVLIDSALDDLRESYSLALITAGPEVTRERLLGLAGCLAVRQRAGSLHAIFQLDPEEAREVLDSALGIGDMRTTSIALEEMFIELLGGHGVEATGGPP